MSVEQGNGDECHGLDADQEPGYEDDVVTGLGCSESQNALRCPKERREKED